MRRWRSTFLTPGAGARSAAASIMAPIRHGAHPAGRNYVTFPVNSNEAEARRLARFEARGHADFYEPPPEAPHPEFPATLDLRRPRNLADLALRRTCSPSYGDTARSFRADRSSTNLITAWSSSPIYPSRATQRLRRKISARPRRD
jgi:putative amidoligase enzyme DUF2126